jgi:hypothetical protein
MKAEIEAHEQAITECKEALAQPEQGPDEAAIRADEREAIFNLVQKIAARFYKDDAEKAFEELIEAIICRNHTRKEKNT